MLIQAARDLPWEPADPAHFTGQARVQRLPPVSGEAALKGYRVEFEPAARTHWHAHSGTQLLVILAGRCRLQTWGGAVREADAGELVVIEPGEKHWHGASPTGPATHLALNLDAATTWMEAVSEAQYATGVAATEGR